MSEVKSVIVLAGAAVFLSIALVQCASATDCPPNLASCKVLILTPDEENLLVGKNGILDTAMQARQMDLGRAVTFFYQKIATAPAGEVKAPPAEASKPTEVPTPAPIPTPDPRK